jgi:cation:H+ antiporter
MITAVSTTHAVIRREGLLMLTGVSVLAIILLSGFVTRIAGLVLLVGMLVAMWLLVRWGRQSTNSQGSDLDDIEVDDDQLGVEILYGGAALVATVVAGQQLLIGVEGIGTTMGLSVVFMGLITGVGTSLPELSAAVAASRRGQSGLVLGNVLGSNLFNSLGVAGLAIVIQPGPISSLGTILIVMMVGAAVFAGVFAATSQRVSRIEGLILITVFVGYVVMTL